MFRSATLFGLIGLIFATGLIVWSGFDEVIRALAIAGSGIVVVAAVHLVPLYVAAMGWRVLMPGQKRFSPLLFIYFMWIRAAVNNLMPVARVGGEIAAIRLMTAHGMRKNIAIAITVVELTLSIVAIFIFIALGAILFALHLNNKNIIMQMTWGLICSLPMVAALFFVQKIGFFSLLVRILHTLFRNQWVVLASNAARLDRTVASIYRRKDRILICTLMQFLAWSFGAVEIWLALIFLRHPLSLLEAIMIEASIQASVSVAFAIPGALGVQEASFILFGGLLGIPHDVAAALAVIRRCRDLICYAPGLVAWQVHEGRKLLHR